MSSAMLKRGCAIDADSRSSIRETLAIGSAGSRRARTPFTASGERGVLWAAVLNEWVAPRVLTSLFGFQPSR